MGQGGRKRERFRGGGAVREKSSRSETGAYVGKVRIAALC